MAGKPSGRQSADVELEATVRARELRFQQVPETRVELYGTPKHDGDSGSDRTNLPPEVEPHVTYHGVEIDQRIVNVLLDRRRPPPEPE